MSKMFRILAYIFVACLVSCVSKNNSTNVNGDNTDTSSVVADTVPVVYMEYGLDVTDCISSEGHVKDGEIITALLSRLGAPSSLYSQLLTLPDSVFNPRILRAGNKFVAYHSCDSLHKLKYWVYSRSAREYIVFDFSADSIHVSEYYKPVKRVSRQSLFVIKSSLWQAMADAAVNPNLTLRLSDIFAWTVDFFGLQKGDKFRVVYDELFIDSVSAGIDLIRAASFSRNNNTYYAVFFENDSVSGYWEPSGNSVKKAFLKAPLSFSRISSHFSYARKHPVYKTVRPHTGVDYAAPAGTPVMAIGDGIVIEKGYKGGGGHTVKIRHNSVYTSAYLHLSRYGKDISVGSRVVQGQVIGYVGSSGTSTGPHLDFRIWKNGTPIDPLKMQSPPSEPMPQLYRHEFDSIVRKYTHLLDSIR